MESPRGSRRHFLGLGAAVPVAILAGGILASPAADAADADRARPQAGGRKPETHYRPATEVLKFC